MSLRTRHQRPPHWGTWGTPPPRRSDSSSATVSRALGFLAFAAMVWATVVVPVLDGLRGAPDDAGPLPMPVMPELDVEPPPPGTLPALLEANPIYLAGALTPVDCPAPALPDAGTAAQRTYYEQILRCLIDAWREPLRHAGLPEGEPRLFAFTEAGTSPCGSFQPEAGRILAFYCPGNETTYMDVEQMARTFPPPDHIAFGLIFAHEFGHHAQHVAGILATQSRLAYESPEQELELSRRKETQASCFAGMFFSSIESSYPVQGVQRQRFDEYAYNSIGDSPDEPEGARTHGSAQTQGNWVLRGFAANEAAICNTYIAAPGEVS